MSIRESLKNKLKQICFIFVSASFLYCPYPFISEGWCAGTKFDAMTVVDPDPGSDQNEHIADRLQQLDHEQYEKNKRLEKSCRPRFGLPGYDIEA